MIKNKKAQVEMLVGWVISVVILMVVWLLIKIFLALPGAGAVAQAGPGVTIASYDASTACDYWLTNFLRAKTSSGAAHSDVLAAASESAKQKGVFDAAAQNYFDKTYRRSLSLHGLWSLKAETAAQISITSLGSKGPARQNCAQKIPSSMGPIKVELGVDY